MKKEDLPSYELFDKDTQAIMFGRRVNAVQRMVDFDYICGRKKPSIACIVDPGKASTHKVFWGDEEILIPIRPNCSIAYKKHPEATVMINFASFRSSYNATMEALNASSIKTVVVIAEGIPERRAREIAATAKAKKKVVIGPATVGGVKAGCFRIGNSAGTIENIIECKLYRPGSVGFVSKSGGMSNEMFNIIARNTDGIYEGIAIGGDAYPGSTLLDHLLRYEKNPKIKMLVCLGEVGGTEEYDIVRAVKSGQIKKPFVMWSTGTCSKVFPRSVQFGHAGAKADRFEETADAKNQALKKAGVIVPQSFDDFDEKIRVTFNRLKKQGKIKPASEPEIPELPMDYTTAVKEEIVRKPTNLVCTISDDTGEEPTYAGVAMSKLFERGYTLGDIIGLLWFKKKLPKFATEFIEMVLMIVADHGPCVSGAHNAIVASCAGKDLVSSLASGILTIGPRFGGAIDGAAMHFKRALDEGMTPVEFVADMKSKIINIPGIGHRIKSMQNPDQRVELLKTYAKKNFPYTGTLDYALKVEKLTTAKKNNLILNVDGCVGILFVDLMYSCGFNEEEVQEVVDLGYLNGLFVLGRSIGIIGHIMDQKRLKSRLYRHPQDDIAYMVPDDVGCRPVKPISKKRAKELMKKRKKR
ncbi:MAG: citrate/2-methylcitrate synthase [Candidatus Altiarchaeota archaeon]